MGKEKFILFNAEHKSILWLPQRTGSTHCWSIMSNLGFKVYRINSDTNEIIFNDDYTKNMIGQVHDHNLINGHEKYTLIQSIRNPYSMVASIFRMRTIPISESDKEKFYDFIYYAVYDSKIREDFNYTYRKPDYFIRLEHNYNDYSKIPFVRNSEIFKSGELELKCKIPLNKNFLQVVSWKKFYTQETADIVYYNFSKIFNELGYDKDSWKE